MHQPTQQPLALAANERTFLSWVQLAVTLGALATILLSFTAFSNPVYQGGYRAWTSTLALTLILGPVGVFISLYSFIMYCARR